MNKQTGRVSAALWAAVDLATVVSVGATVVVLLAVVGGHTGGTVRTVMVPVLWAAAACTAAQVLRVAGRMPSVLD